MKIAIFSETIDVTNGHGNITYELCLALHKKGIDFTLFLPDDEPLDRAYPFAVERKLPKYIFRVYTPKVFRHLFDSIDLRGYDAVHCLFAFPHSFFAARMASRYHLPLIMGAQGTYGVLPLTYPIERHMLMHSYKQAQAIIVPSAFTKQEVLKYARTPLEITIIHNGVNYERFARPLDTSALSAQFGNKKLLVTVGGLKNRKGQDLVIRALPTVLAQHPDTAYLIVGGGDASYFTSLASEVGVKDHVFFTGRVSDDDLLQYFHLADIYVHTPRLTNLNFEGFGIVYLEAGACGTPVVATDSGGIRDAVIEGTTGLIAKDENVDDIARKIIKLLDNPELMRQLGNGGREYAKQHTWDSIAEQFIAFYKKYART